MPGSQGAVGVRCTPGAAPPGRAGSAKSQGERCSRDLQISNSGSGVWHFVLTFVVSCCCFFVAVAGRCCCGWLFRLCAGGTALLLVPRSMLTSPHLTSPHLTSPHLTLEASRPWGPSLSLWAFVLNPQTLISSLRASTLNSQTHNGSLRAWILGPQALNSSLRALSLGSQTLNSSPDPGLSSNFRTIVPKPSI